MVIQGVIFISGDAYSNESGGNSNSAWYGNVNSSNANVNSNNTYNSSNNAPRPDFYKTRVYESIWS